MTIDEKPIALAGELQNIVNDWKEVRPETLPDHTALILASHTLERIASEIILDVMGKMPVRA